MSQRIKLTDIRTSSCQTRAEINREAVTEYIELFEGGSEFPPIDAYHELGSEGQDVYWLGDGLHRLTAATILEHETIAAEVFTGTCRDALECSLKSNWRHGVRRTPEDKRLAVQMALEDSVWQEWSDRKLATFCGVSDYLVAKVRQEIQVRAHAPEPAVPAKRIGKDGKAQAAKKRRSRAAAIQEAKSNGKLAEAATKEPVPAAPADDSTDFDPVALAASPAAGVDIDALAGPYRAAVRQLNAMSSEFEGLAADPKLGVHLGDKITRLKGYLREARETISQMEPVCACEGCDGAGCNTCFGSGFWTRTVRGSRKK